MHVPKLLCLAGCLQDKQCSTSNLCCCAAPLNLFLMQFAEQGSSSGRHGRTCCNTPGSVATPAAGAAKDSWRTCRSCCRSQAALGRVARNCRGSTGGGSIGARSADCRQRGIVQERRSLALPQTTQLLHCQPLPPTCEPCCFRVAQGFQLMLRWCPGCQIPWGTELCCVGSCLLLPCWQLPCFSTGH